MQRAFIMSKKMINKIEEMELKLDGSAPNRIAPLVKKLIKTKDRFINGK
jgi:hypothetical protein